VNRVGRRIAVVGLCAALLASCSVEGEQNASRVASEDVPFNLLDETTTTNPSSSSEPITDISDVYLVRDDRLRVVTRSEDAFDAGTLLELLAAGPTDEEIAEGIRTALVPDLAVVTGAVADVVTVDLSAEFSALAPTEQRLALAQITVTLTQLPAVSAVRFLVAGDDVSVPRGDGSSVERPVTPADYAELAPP
jgi:hypothetical protein